MVHVNISWILWLACGTKPCWEAIHDPALHTTFNPPFSTMADLKASTTSLYCSSFKSGESSRFIRFGWNLSMTLDDDPCDGEWSRFGWKLSMTLGDDPCDGEWWTRIYDGGLEGEASWMSLTRFDWSIEMNHTSNQTKQIEIEIELRTLLTFLCFFERVFFAGVFFGGGASLFFFLGWPDYLMEISCAVQHNQHK